MTLLVMLTFLVMVSVIVGSVKVFVAVSNRWDRRKELEIPKPLVITAEMCSLYEIRLTQSKMVEAGIISAVDVSVCENRDCPNCKPTREAEDRRRRTVTVNEMRALRQSTLERRFAEQNRRTRTIEGREIPIPKDVPDYADAKIDYDPKWQSDVILWVWRDRSTGYRMYKKTNLLIRDFS